MSIRVVFGCVSGFFDNYLNKNCKELYAYFVKNYRYLTGNPREENLVRRKWKKKCHPDLFYEGWFGYLLLFPGEGL